MPGVPEYPVYNQPVPGQQFTGAIPTYPAPYGTTQEGSTGGLVNRAGIIQAGVQNGINQQQQIEKGMRDTQAYNEQQAKNKAKGDLGTPDSPTAPAAGHADFMSSVLQGLHSLGAGAAHMFGGGGIPAPAAGPAPMQDGGPVLDSHGQEIKKSTGWDLAKQAVKEVAGAVAGSGAGARAADASRAAVGAAGYHADAMMNGGPVTPEFMHSGMGVVAGGVQGIPGFAEGGPIPTQPTAPGVAQEGNSGGLVNTSGIVQAGVQNGINQSQQINQGQRDQTAFAQQQAAAHAKGDVDMPSSPEHARAEAGRAIDEAHQLLDNHTLDHNDVPKAAALAAPAAGVPDQQAAATAQVAQQTAANPDAQAGNPGPTKQPHSITPDQWAAYDKRKEYAIKMAAYAGEDPGQVRGALDASRNAWVQGGVLRYLSAANANLLSGNQKGVETALKNAYYYLPDGQDLSIAKDKDGNLVYQDPFTPKTADGKPNMIPVDAAHIQMLGQAMLDPMNVQTTIQNVMTARAKVELEHAQAQAAVMTGQGNYMKGHGIEMGGQAHLGEVNSTNYKNFAEGDAARIRATAISNHLNNLAAKMPNMDPEILKAANSASDQFDKQASGELGTVPLQIPDTRPGHQGEMVPNPDPNAGKPMRDPTKIPDELKNLTPSQVMEGRAVAGNITLANRGMPPAEAVRLAALYAASKNAPPKKTPKGADGKPMKNVYTDSKTGDTHVWNPAMKKWEAFKLPLQSSQDLATTGNLNVPDPIAAAEVASNGNGGSSGGIPAGNSDLDAAKNEPDMEPQSFPASS